MSSQEPFPQVDEFAKTMKGLLIYNAHKGGWQDCSFDFLYMKLGEEIGEVLKFADDPQRMGFLAEMFNAIYTKPKGNEDHELADAANILMMIGDVKKTRREKH